ncbi:hypothetical protein ALC53_06879 [Atta colombica]|uniref:Uncharacterized protein n=1 Tax=Atta colombica TaxID=520822 RepID=A0A195BER7_9HYME|nr:hypothetical protein ALC53_06879 [Atta colombica]
MRKAFRRRASEEQRSKVDRKELALPDVIPQPVPNSLSISTPHHFNSHFFKRILKQNEQISQISLSVPNIGDHLNRNSLYLSFDLSVPSGFISDLSTCAISILSGRRVENVALPLYGNYNVQLA